MFTSLPVGLYVGYDVACTVQYGSRDDVVEDDDDDDDDDVKNACTSFFSPISKFNNRKQC